MCGICGIYNYKTGRPVSQNELQAMNQALRHRGPDDEGIYMNGEIGLAMKRLSIIDLKKGKQPLSNASQTTWVVNNGEIYNYRELTRDLKRKGYAFSTESDTEVLVHLYDEYGLEYAKYLNGMFGTALWDGKSKSLILGRDRSGVKPLYLSETKDGIVFSSEIKSLLTILPDVEEDPVALNQYLSLGYIPYPLTGFKNISKLEVGTLLKISSGGQKVRHSFDRFQKVSLSSGEESPEGVLRHLETAVQRQLVSDVSLGLLLSGGVDSSLIAAVAAKRLGVKLDAFTIQFSESSYDESGDAAKTAKHLGLNNHPYLLDGSQVAQSIETILDFQDEPFYDYSSIPTYFITKFAKQNVKVLLAGDGGDELFGGYPTHYLPHIVNIYRRIPSFLRSLISSSVHMLPARQGKLSLDYKLKRFIRGAGRDHFQNHWSWKELFNDQQRGVLLHGSDDPLPIDFSFGRPYMEEAHKGGANLVEQLMHLDYKVYLQDDCLQKSDRMSMANGIEVRVPFLDNDMIDYSRNLKASKKVKMFQTKRMVRDALQSILPVGIAYKKKQGFTPPMALWIKKELRDFVQDSLRTQYSGKAGALIEKVLKEHEQAKSEISREIWGLVTLAEWRRRFIQKKREVLKN